MSRNYKPKAWIVAIAVVVVIVFLAQRIGRLVSPASPQPRNDAPEAQSSFSGGGASNADEPLLVEGAELAPALREVALAGEIGERWQARYPQAEVLQERFHQTSPNRWLRQQLLRTGLERLPYVVWEDKLRQDENGAWLSGSSAAYMGNVFLAQSTEDLVDPAELAAFLQEHELYVERESELSGYSTFGLREPRLGRLEQLVQAYRERFPMAIVEREVIHFTSATPSDWKSDRLWGLDQIKALDAWRFETGAEEVVVAVLDTGLDTNHPDIQSNLYKNPRELVNGLDSDGNGLKDDVTGWDFYDSDPDTADDDGHGTHVAGIVAAAGNNAVGSIGAAWGVKVLPLRVGDETGLRTSSIVDALQYVEKLKTRQNNPVNIVATNNSYGSGSASAATRSEIEKHRNAGILFVAAAGNDGYNMDSDEDLLQYPASYTLDNLISVANSNQEDGLTASSNRGSTSVDLSAPGEFIYSTYRDGGYSFLSGTSMASPMVAGAVALLASAEPQLTWQQRRDRLFETADKVEGQQGLTVTGGRLNLLSALKPELQEHNIEVVNLEDSIVILDTLETTLRFETKALSSATVSAQVIEGSAVGSIRALGAGVFDFLPSAPGLARVRFRATLQGVVREIEKTVVVEGAGDVLSGLVHRYEFEGSGSNEEDMAGASAGSLSGTTRVDTEFGKALRFSGGSSNMEFTGKHTPKVTLAALVKSEDLLESAHPRIVNMPFYYLFFSSGEGSGVPDGNRHTMKFFVERSQSPGIWNTPPRSIRDNEWVYLVATYDNASARNVPSLYLNGERQVPRMQQDPAGAAVVSTGSSYLGNNGADDRAFEGLMASVRIYDRELSSAEVGSVGAALAEEKWKRYRLAGLVETMIGAESAYSVRDMSNELGENRASWRVEGDGAYEIVSQSQDEVSIRFLEEAEYRVQALVSDGFTTRVFSKTVASTQEEVRAGVYTGATEAGGFVWLEADSDLETGLVSILDLETGFYRLNEPVAIEASGAFSTRETSIGTITGSIVGGMTGEVAGYGIRFSGAATLPSQDATAYAGIYRGGALGSAGDLLELRVWPDGRVALWREGRFADLGKGGVSADDSISIETARGESFVARFNPETKRLLGTIGDAAIFLLPAGEASTGELRGGLIAGASLGQGGQGLYGNFVREGEAAEPGLLAGSYAKPAAASSDGQLFVMEADLSFQVLQTRSEVSAIESVAAAVSSGALALRESPLRAIQAQIPLSAAGGTLIGFSIVGDEPKEVLLRGLGPAFAAGSGARDPSLALFRLEAGSLTPIATNLNWSDDTLFTTEGEMAQGPFRALETGFAELAIAELPLGSLDAAMRLWLPPGDYLLEAKSEDETVGASFIEVFELP